MTIEQRRTRRTQARNLAFRIVSRFLAGHTPTPEDLTAFVAVAPRGLLEAPKVEAPKPAPKKVAPKAKPAKAPAAKPAPKKVTR